MSEQWRTEPSFRERMLIEAGEYPNTRVVAQHVRPADAEQIVRDHNDAEALRAEVARLRRALAWYADESRYSTETSVVLNSADSARHAPFVWDTVEIIADGGERARAALAAAEPAPSSGGE